jgi:histidinol-phosphatase (PHP family)
MQVFCLTEHMPRHKEDFYPEEIEAGQTEAWHESNEAAYWEEAQRLRTKYASQIKIIIGFECDWIRPESKDLIDRSLSRFPFEFFVGSVHHMHTVPIDFDRPMYERARKLAGGTDERLFEDYFDAQLDMLKELKPLVVGHFDLIRLKSDDMERSFMTWPGVWSRILRNLEFIASYGGMLELNGAALRKGMSEPYPKAEICKVCEPRDAGFELQANQHFSIRSLWHAEVASVFQMTAMASARLV